MNDNSEELFYPAADSFVLSVAGTQYDDSRYDYSNFGHWIDIAAPAAYIYTTSNNGDYSNSFSGTSAASAFVTGLSALLISNFPQDDISAIKSRILSTTDITENSSSTYFGKMGTGRINAYKALDLEPSPHLLLTSLSYNEKNEKFFISKGDTLELRISVKNYWEEAAELNCILETLDSGLQCLNPILDIGELPSGTSFSNETNPFLVVVSDELDDEEAFSILFKFNSSYPYTKIIETTLVLNRLYEKEEGYPVNGGFDPLCLDYDKDGSQEFVYNKDKTIKMVGYDLSLRNDWPVNIPNYANLVSAGDITGDGYFEIVFSIYNELHVLDYRGNELVSRHICNVV